MSDYTNAVVAAIVTPPAIFVALMPGVDKMLAVQDADTARVQHDMQVAAFAVSVGIGVILSVMSQSALPAMAAAIVATGLVGASHYLITLQTEVSAHV